MIEKGTIKVGDELEGSHKGTTYHVRAIAANGDGTMVFEALDGPKSGERFKSLSAAAAATGSVRNGWTFFSLAGKAPLKGGRPKKNGNGLVQRFRCTACGSIYKTEKQATECHKGHAGEGKAGFEPVMVDPMGPSKDAPAGGLAPEKPARKARVNATARLEAIAAGRDANKPRKARRANLGPPPSTKRKAPVRRAPAEHTA